MDIPSASNDKYGHCNKPSGSSLQEAISDHSLANRNFLNTAVNVVQNLWLRDLPTGLSNFNKEVSSLYDEQTINEIANRLQTECEAAESKLKSSEKSRYELLIEIHGFENDIEHYPYKYDVEQLERMNLDDEFKQHLLYLQQQQRRRSNSNQGQKMNEFKVAESLGGSEEDTESGSEDIGMASEERGVAVVKKE